MSFEADYKILKDIKMTQNCLPQEGEANDFKFRAVLLWAVLEECVQLILAHGVVQ